jgi:ABC-type spermidine/putrescine transport system permease subunit I
MVIFQKARGGVTLMSLNLSSVATFIGLAVAAYVAWYIAQEGGAKNVALDAWDAFWNGA